MARQTWYANDECGFIRGGGGILRVRTPPNCNAKLKRINEPPNELGRTFTLKPLLCIRKRVSNILALFWCSPRTMVNENVLYDERTSDINHEWWKIKQILEPEYSLRAKSEDPYPCRTEHFGDPKSVPRWWFSHDCVDTWKMTAIVSK